VSDDKPKIEAVEDEPEGMPYQVVLSIGMVGDIQDQVQLELTAKMTVLVDAMIHRHGWRHSRSSATRTHGEDDGAR